MKTTIAAMIILFAVVAGLIYADSQWGTETKVKIAPVTPIVIPAIYYYTAEPEPEPDIPGDLWRCLQNPTLALDAPDITLDHNTFDVIDLRIIGEQGQIHVYQVFNHGRNETRPVTVEYGADGDGYVVLVRCDVPLEWGNFPPASTPFPLNTPANQPGEGVGQPES